MDENIKNALLEIFGDTAENSEWLDSNPPTGEIVELLVRVTAGSDHPLTREEAEKLATGNDITIDYKI